MVYQRTSALSLIHDHRLILGGQVLLKGDMLDYYSVSGCYILKPMSYSIWEEIQGGDREISLASSNLTDLSLAHSCPYVVTCPTPTRP
jgi:hypothetical protein